MDKFIKRGIYFVSITTFLSLISIIIYIIIKGLPNLDPGLFSLNYTSENMSLMPSIITTLIITLISLSISLPIGILTAIYLVEYSSGNLFMKLINIAIDTLTGIPSIIYGLFGMIFFVTYLQLGFSILAGAFTLSIMILPLIIGTSKEALLTVPESLRWGSLALGASKVRTIFKVVIPSSLPGIFSGIILSIGRIFGESAALIYTAGTVSNLPKSLLSSSRTLSVHMYALSTEGLHTDKAYGTAFVLMLLILLINFLSNFFMKKILKEK